MHQAPEFFPAASTMKVRGFRNDRPPYIRLPVESQLIPDIRTDVEGGRSRLHEGRGPLVSGFGRDEGHAEAQTGAAALTRIGGTCRRQTAVAWLIPAATADDSVQR